MWGNAGSNPLLPPRPGGSAGTSLEGNAGVLIYGTFLLKFFLLSVFLRCDFIECTFEVSSFSPGMAGRGCCAFLCRGDIEPVTSDILLDYPGKSSPVLELPGVAGKRYPCILSILDGSLGFLEPFCEEEVEGVANDEVIVGGALGRSHDDCFVCAGVVVVVVFIIVFLPRLW